MTDNHMDLMQTGQPHKQPIVTAGRVAYNGRLDSDLLDERRRTGASKSLWPGASVNDIDQWILRRDICLQPKRRAGRRGQDSLLNVFGTLGGAGEPGQTMREFIEQHVFAGIAGGQGAIYDSSGNNPRFPEFALVFGGLDELSNNGNERVHNGQFVYWDPPSSNTGMNEMSRRDSQRITPVLRPYDPTKHSVSEAAVKEAIRKPSSSSDAPGPSDEAAVGFKRFAMTMALNAFAGLMASGLVKMDEDALGTGGNAAAARGENAADWARVGASGREDVYVRMARALGCRNVRDPGHNSSVTVPGHNMSLKQYMLDLLTGDTLLVARNGGIIPGGDKGEVCRNQSAAISDVVSASAKADYYIRRRIIGRALTPAAPGKAFDIRLGVISA